MENESSAGGVAPFDQFNFTFDDDDDDDDHFVTNHNMQMPSNQKNKAAEHVDLGSSSSGSSQPMNRARSRESVTVSAFTPFSGLSDPLHEQRANLASMGASSSTPLVETPQSHRHITIEELSHALQSNESQPNPEKSGPSVSNFPSPEVAFNPELEGASQPHHPRMYNLEPGSSVGNNWFSLNQANSTQIFMRGAVGFPSYQYSNPPLMFAQNDRETIPFYFNLPMPIQPHRPRPMHMGVTIRDGVVEPHHPEPEPNVAIQSHPQMEQVPLSLTLGHSQYGINTMMAELGVADQRPSQSNQQQATLYPQQLNDPPRPWTPSGFWTQNNQVMPANGACNQQWTNCIPHGAVQTGPRGPQQLLNQPQQLNQVQPPNTFGSQQCHHPRRPAGLSAPLWSPKHTKRENVLTPWILESSFAARVQSLPETQDNHNQAVPPHHSNSTKPDPFMQSGLGQVSDHQEQPHKDSRASNVAYPQQHDSIVSGPIIASGPQGMGGQQKNPDHVQMIPDVVADIKSRPSVLSNIADPQNHSSGLSRAPMPFRLAPVQLDDILNQSTIPSDSSSQRSVQFQNSPTEQGTAEQRDYVVKRRGKQLQLGESSSLAKRSKRNSAASSRTEVNRSTFESQEKEMDMLSNLFSPSNAREIKNSLYDPAFEAIGLPIDPHLRMFQASKQFLQ
ncbi:hypothetical protein L3X38_008385 [Prunus dulcis]|uniref:Uncharacterized protein n=1 Tax=Prunus dulcis TaxID=3755 RepID=A0AAD5F731_PRUDU|nr:hypothetical protein L3X38_008385 [Prunus dulcis]